MSDAYNQIKKQKNSGSKGLSTDLIMRLSLKFFEKKSKDLPIVLKHLALWPGGLTNEDLVKIMPRWKEYVPILIKKSFIIEKPRARKESQPLNKSHKNNKRQKIYQIDKSLSGLILESMNKEEVVDFDRKIVQLIVNKSSK